MHAHRLSLVLLAVAALVLPGPAAADTTPITCVAHRGGPTDHTEETIATYGESLDAGVPVVEGDVRFTSTDYPVLNHDPTLTQFGQPSLALASLTQGQATGYASATGDHMATLWQLGTAVLAHPRARAEVELKTNPTAAQWTILATRLDRIRDRLTVTSFSPTTLRAVQDHGYRVALNTEDDVSTTLAPVVSQNADTVDAATVQRLADVGVATEAWTPDTTGALDQMAAAGVTIMLTNDPLACMAWEANR
jgi:glycerophosphoryl diester phosphodiesterase